MTDLEKFVELYKSIGIGVEITQDGDSQFICLGQPELKSTNTWMWSTVIFDKNGKFVQQEFWD